MKEDPPAVLYGIGGTVTGIAGATLTLESNDHEVLMIRTDGPYVFMKRVPSNYGYLIKFVGTSDERRCTIHGSLGTPRSAEVTNVDVVCTPP